MPATEPAVDAAEPAGSAVVAPGRWLAARLVESRMETRSARTLVLDVPGWRGHDAGQHVDVRLTAEDGYTAQRSYSIASVGEPDRLELTVQRVRDGEVSTYLVEVMADGDQLELRGPLGGWFRWTPSLRAPVLLLAGGSGIVPLMAMLRARVRSTSAAPFHLLYSTRTPDHVFYAAELHETGRSTDQVRVDRIFTRSGLPDDPRAPGRLRPEDVPPPGDEASRAYVCGPNGFVEHATRVLLERGHPASEIRTERFG